ncbi:MAG: hypothetical protein ACTHKC_05255, partial [Candidatus Nitrosocosmicus sp.]
FPFVLYQKFFLYKNYIQQQNLSVTDTVLFKKDRKYLNQHDFKILKTSDLGYNQTTNYIYIKGPLNSQMRNC